MKLVTDTFNFKSGGLHEKHVVATWNLGSHLSNFCDRLKPTYSKPTYSVQAIKNKVNFSLVLGN
jgi:hypothetical protein